MPAIRLGLSVLLWAGSTGTESVHAWWFGLLNTDTLVALEEWTPEKGDTFIVDTKENIGYLVHTDSTYTSFPVVTGQRRFVYYIGRYYDATTPERLWEVKRVDTKWDRITFGSRGIFMRFWHDGEETPYGIHAYKHINRIMDQEERYGSMGCILVTDPILDVLLKTFEINGESIRTRTVYGLPEGKSVSEALRTLMSV